MIIAIDGPAGSGKSTVASRIARELGFIKLDTGAMYRSVAWAAGERGVDLADERALTELAEGMRIRFEPDGEDGMRILVDGEDVSRAIRTPEVDATVSVAAAVPGVRAAMLEQQRAVAASCSVVAEGRDIGTVVFPDAEVKVFLTADPRERARRRVLQRYGADALTPEELEAEVERTCAAIEERDRLDSSRETAPLVAADDAVRIDSSALTLDEVVACIVALAASHA